MTKILIIDDEIDICEMLKSFFEARGYTVIYAITGQGGIDAFEVESPQVIMLDLCLKDMWGLEVLKKVRNTDKACIVIIITASASESDRLKAMELGADYYIDKPFSIAKLSGLLTRLGV